MSAYAHQMEREISLLSQSASSTRTSEMGSRYESGFAVSSFTATILIGALVVTAVSLLSLLTVLTVMLQSCQTKSEGVINISESSNICKMLAAHAEMNGLRATNEIPLMCREEAIRYITGGQYARDLEFAVGLAVGYFNSLTPQANGLDIVLMDADDLLPSIHHNISIIQSSCIVDADLVKHKAMLMLYKALQSEGWQLVLVSRRPVGERNATIDYLASSGYTNWFLLIMRSSYENEIDSNAYMSRQRANMQEKGYRLVGSVSSKMDALMGAFLGDRMFKLPTTVPINYCYL